MGCHCAPETLLFLHFALRVDMEALVQEGAFLEHAVFGGNMYGTSRASVAKVANQGKICILDIDMQGVKQIKQSGLKARFFCPERDRVLIIFWSGTCSLRRLVWKS